MANVIGAPERQTTAIGAAAAEVSGTAIFSRSRVRYVATVTGERRKRKRAGFLKPLSCKVFLSAP